MEGLPPLSNIHPGPADSQRPFSAPSHFSSNRPRAARSPWDSICDMSVEAQIFVEYDDLYGGDGNLFNRESTDPRTFEKATADTFRWRAIRQAILDPRAPHITTEDDVLGVLKEFLAKRLYSSDEALRHHFPHDHAAICQVLHSRRSTKEERLDWKPEDDIPIDCQKVILCILLEIGRKSIYDYLHATMVVISFQEEYLSCASSLPIYRDSWKRFFQPEHAKVSPEFKAPGFAALMEDVEELCLVAEKPEWPEWRANPVTPEGLILYVHIAIRVIQQFEYLLRQDFQSQTEANLFRLCDELETWKKWSVTDLVLSHSKMLSLIDALPAVTEEMPWYEQEMITQQKKLITIKIVSERHSRRAKLGVAFLAHVKDTVLRGLAENFSWPNVTSEVRN